MTPHSLGCVPQDQCIVSGGIDVVSSADISRSNKDVTRKTSVAQSCKEGDIFSHATYSQSVRRLSVFAVKATLTLHWP